MIGENNSYFSSSKKDNAEKDPYDKNKEIILRNAKLAIGGAVDIIFHNNKAIGKNDITEDEFILDVLQYLSPTNKRMWGDKEMIEATREIIREKASGKNIIDDSQEAKAEGEAIAKPDKIGIIKIRKDAYGHEMRNKIED